MCQQEAVPEHGTTSTLGAPTGPAWPLGLPQPAHGPAPHGHQPPSGWCCGRARLQVPTVCWPWVLPSQAHVQACRCGPAWLSLLTLASRLTSWPEHGPASSPWGFLVLGWTLPPFASDRHIVSVCSTHLPVWALGSKALAQGTPQLLAPILLDYVQGSNCLWALKVPIISFPPKQEHYLLGCCQIQSEWLHSGFPNYLSGFCCWNSSVWNPLTRERGFIAL